LYTIRVAHRFPTQVGSESMCKKRWFRPPLLTILPYSAVNLAGCWANLLSTGGGLTPRTVPLGGRPWPLKPWDPWIPGNAEACGLLAAGQQTRPLVVSRGKPPCAIRRSPAVARGPGPPSEGRMPQPVPARPGGGRNLCVRTGAEEPRGGNLMAARAPPVRRGRSRRSGAPCAPSV
jgi:hypothetical protein